MLDAIHREANYFKNAASAALFLFKASSNLTCDHNIPVTRQGRCTNPLKVAVGWSDESNELGSAARPRHELEGMLLNSGEIWASKAGNFHSKRDPRQNTILLLSKAKLEPTVELAKSIARYYSKL